MSKQNRHDSPEKAGTLDLEFGFVLPEREPQNESSFNNFLAPHRLPSLLFLRVAYRRPGAFMATVDSALFPQGANWKPSTTLEEHTAHWAFPLWRWARAAYGEQRKGTFLLKGDPAPPPWASRRHLFNSLPAVLYQDWQTYCYTIYRTRSSGFGAQVVSVLFNI